MFKKFRNQIEEQFNKLSKGDLFIVDIDKDVLWNLYLDSFPKGTNEIFREKREYDCNNCKNFIRNIGAVVTIKNGKLISVWDIEPDGYYADVAKAMNQYIISRPLKDAFFHNEKKVGKATTISLVPGSKDETETFTHFACILDDKFFTKDIASKKARIRDAANVLHRGLKEFKLEAFKLVIELTEQKSIYRAEEFLPKVKEFLEMKLKYDKQKSDKQKKMFAWNNARSRIAKFRNSVMGTLLQDLSEGMELTLAVSKFEDKMNGAKYKRSKPLMTEGMKKKLLTKIIEDGLEPSLRRRFAVPSDISINNVIYADRSTSGVMKDSLESLLDAEIKPSKKKFDKVEEIAIEDFIEHIVPNASAISILADNKHIGNFVSLVAPEDDDHKKIFQWDNAYSWSYINNVTDSMKERVVAAGGRVDGAFRFTHSWNEIEPNQSLMDLHVFMPGCKIPISGGGPDIVGRRVGWNKRTDPLSDGIQDVDHVQAASVGFVPIENITFPKLSKMPPGKYVCKIHNWKYRGSGGKGKAEIEINGDLYQYEYPATTHHEWITVAEITLKDNIFTIKHKLPHNDIQKEEWEIKTQVFQKVSMLMLSPNYWDNQKIGNKHYFFMLENCINPERTRGFYNEFLRSDMNEYRKAFEVLADKLKCEHSEQQLSGLGFSSTMRNDLIVKVEGNFTRTLKIKF